MTDAVRNVTILLNIKPGDINKPDMSWLTQATEDAKSLTKDVNSLTDVIGNMRKETTEMVKTQEEAARVDRELIDGQKDLLTVTTDTLNKTIDAKKREAQEEIRIETETVRQIEEIRRPLREPRQVRPLTEPDGKVPGVLGGKQRSASGFDFSDVSSAIEKQIDDNFDKFEANEKKKTELALREIAERAEAARQAEEDLPKHWRNTLLNAGQATASVARYISHMRMLKAVGGDSLEDMAKKFMTVQSRVEMIAASTSAFTNFGTMLDGLKQVGAATEKVVAQQLALGQATSVSQSITMKLARSAAEIAPLVAPAQMIFTGITASIVAADIAMDLFSDAGVSAREQQEKMLKLFDEQLDKVIKKLNEETKIIEQQNNLLQTQWDIRELIAGDAGMGATELDQRNQEMRAQQDAESEQKLRQQTEQMFADKMNQNQKQRQAEIQAQREALQQQIEFSDAFIASGEADASVIQRNEDLRRQQRENEEKQRQLDHETGKFNRRELQNANIQNGQIADFDGFMTHANNLPANERTAFLGLTAGIMSENNQAIIAQQREADNKAKQAEQRAQREQAEMDRQQREMDQERATAERYGMADSQWRVQEAQREMQAFQTAATPELREEAAQAAMQLLQGGNGQANLMTPEMQAELGLGAAANPDLVMSMMEDASTFTDDERNQYQEQLATSNAALVEARDQAKAMRTLAKDLKAILEENKRQLDALQRAIENRDLN